MGQKLNDWFSRNIAWLIPVSIAFAGTMTGASFLAGSRAYVIDSNAAKLVTIETNQTSAALAQARVAVILEQLESRVSMLTTRQVTVMETQARVVAILDQIEKRLDRVQIEVEKRP